MKQFWKAWAEETGRFLHRATLCKEGVHFPSFLGGKGLRRYHLWEGSSARRKARDLFKKQVALAVMLGWPLANEWLLELKVPGWFCISQNENAQWSGGCQFQCLHGSLASKLRLNFKGCFLGLGEKKKTNHCATVLQGSTVICIVTSDMVCVFALRILIARNK